ncbi:MAG: PCMD domain-containing protein [Bacteroidota bacterium]
MKLRLLLATAVCLCCISANSSAQTTINNSGFENWENLTNDNIEPTNWNSFMTADASGLAALGKAKRLSRSTVKRPGTSGSYSVVIYSTSTLGIIANGNLTTGKINMGSTSPTSNLNYNFTNTSDALFNHPFTGHPDSIIAWVRFKPASNGPEQARINAVIHDNYSYRDPSGSDANAPSHVVGVATLNFPKTNGAWVRKSIPFTYPGPASTSAYLLISLTTNMTGGGGSAGDSLYIDDMDIIYNPILTTGTINPLTYLVSSTMSAAVSVPYTLTGTMYAGNTVTAQLSDASGSFASPITLGSVTSTTSSTISGTIPAGTPTGGAYRIRVVSSTYPITAADNGANIVISDVTGIDTQKAQNTTVYFTENQLVVNLQQATFTNPTVQIVNLSGQTIATYPLKNNSINHIYAPISTGVYMFRIADADSFVSGKIVKL